MRDRIGLAGASLGASLAALAAADDPAVRSIALLSPSLDYRGLRLDAAMRKYAPRPALLVASREDPYAWRSMRELAKDQSAREMVLLDRAGHGTTMLARDGSLVRTLVDWFGKTLL
jgi:pimeloyl-ACP methyl ester carboxylesterase